MTDTNLETNRNNDNDTVYKMYHVLKELTESNAEFFKNDGSTLGKSLYSTCLSIINNLNDIRPLVEHFRNACPAYDFDEHTPGNGYRSYVMMVDSFVVYGVKVSRHISGNRNSYFFRKGTALKELEACEQGLSSLCQMLTHLQVLMEWSDVGCLYPREPHAPEELLSRANNLNQYCFYGRCLGFQFCESMQTILKGLGILMASFSELYYSNGGMIGRATSSLWNSSKYLVNPELRAKRIVNISQYASVNFCKQFWFLGEMETMKRLPNFVTPSVLMNRIIVIPPEPITIRRTVDGTLLDVPIPKSHTGPSSLSVRLMSSVKRLGMLGEANAKNLAPPAEGFLFHCHGGGFVAQSSRSHETYLCQWAKSIDVPILSVDYSLAPEAPFPRALEDTFYAYCWALNNLSILGTTGKRIVAAGDSAGGNLVLGLTVKCIMEGVRPPDGLFLAYVPVIVSIIPSPARLLCLMDPLLPLGFLTGCLRAYACTPEAYEAAVKGFEEKLRHQSQSSKRSSNGPRPQLHQKGVTSESLEIGVDSLQQLNVDNANTVGQNGSRSNDDDMLNGNATVNTNINGDGEEENFVAGFMNKYATATDTIYNNNNGGGGGGGGGGNRRKTLIEENDAKIRKLMLENDVKNNDDDNNIDGVSIKRSNSTLTSIATIIGNTFTSFTGGTTVNNESPLPQTTTPPVTVSGLDNSTIDGSPDNTFQDDDSGGGGGTALLDDFEEVMLPCPLEMLKFEVPDTPLLSPYYASDDILRQFPPTSFMTLHMDPCLDDCVEFSKKLKRLNNRVNIDILEGLPHGFLNFSLLSKEAYEGSKKCTERLKALLDIDGQLAAPVIGTEATKEDNKSEEDSNSRNKSTCNSASAPTLNNL